MKKIILIAGAIFSVSMYVHAASQSHTSSAPELNDPASQTTEEPGTKQSSDSNNNAGSTDAGPSNPMAPTAPDGSPGP